MRFIVVAALVLLTQTAPAVAQQPHQLFTKKLFTINRCDAKKNVTTSGPHYADYSPGYYPGGAYYWSDPYGTGFYQPPTTSSHPQMYVDFINITHKTMKGIMWGLVAGGRLVAEAKDVGSFSPGVEIKKEYGISENVFPLQTTKLQCVALGVKWADGTRDINPNLPERIKKMYASPPPNAGAPQPPKR